MDKTTSGSDQFAGLPYDQQGFAGLPVVPAGGARESAASAPSSKAPASTKLTIENPLDWRSRALLAESEEARLRAENERLRSWSKAAQEAFERGHRLEDEVERYQALLRETLEIWHEEEGKLRAEVQALRDENQRLKAALKIHHDLGLWSLGHEICPECRQAC